MFGECRYDPEPGGTAIQKGRRTNTKTADLLSNSLSTPVDTIIRALIAYKTMGESSEGKCVGKYAARTVRFGNQDL
jgi:hypothetical protein